MKRLLLVAALSLFLLPVFVTRAQDAEYTCDGGPNDIINAAQAAFDAGDLTLAQTLITEAATLCRANLARFPLVSQLRGQIDTLLAVTCDGGPQDLIELARAAFDAGDLTRARFLLTFTDQVCTAPARLAAAAALQDEIAAHIAPPVLPLSPRGPYLVGRRTLSLTDPTRQNWPVEVWINYPAVDGSAGESRLDATPDAGGAPYPLVMISHDAHSLGMTAAGLQSYGSHLASYGFVTVRLQHRRVTVPGGGDFLAMTDPIHRYYDVLFVLERLATLTDSPLAGLIDTSQVGILGYSAGAETAIIVGGARFDLDVWEATVRRWLGDAFADRYDAAWREEALALRASLPPPLTDPSLWPRVAEPRIKAIIAIAPCADIFAPAEMAFIDKPTLLIAGEQDDVCPYTVATSLFAASEEPDHHLLTLLEQDHLFVYQLSAQPIVRHFSLAFFGYYLQGKTDYRPYLSAESAAQWEGVVWGLVD